MILYSNNVLAQLSEDSLQSICLKTYQEDRKLLYLDDNTHKKSIRHLFRNCFSQFDIFLCDECVLSSQTGACYCCLPHTTFFRIYAIDKFSGKLVKFPEYGSFNTFINSASRTISNLDKCYLYLFLNQLETHGVESPQCFSEKIHINSSFDTLTDIIFTSMCNYDYYTYKETKQLRNDIKNSTENKILIDVTSENGHGLNGDKPSRVYTFQFNSDNSLSTL